VARATRAPRFRAISTAPTANAETPTLSAGRSLRCPVSRMDLDIDLGSSSLGRTKDVVWSRPRPGRALGDANADARVPALWAVSAGRPHAPSRKPPSPTMNASSLAVNSPVSARKAPAPRGKPPAPRGNAPLNELKLVGLGAQISPLFAMGPLISRGVRYRLATRLRQRFGRPRSDVNRQAVV
jgi:hypothetical protein